MKQTSLQSRPSVIAEALPASHYKEKHTALDSYIWRGRGKRHEGQQVNVPYNKLSLWRVFSLILTRAKLESITSPHGLRATGATLASQAGVPLSIIRQQLGHSSERMTQDHYIGDAEVGALAAYGAAFE